jgi:hypothetical protein
MIIGVEARSRTSCLGAAAVSVKLLHGSLRQALAVVRDHLRLALD